MTKLQVYDEVKGTDTPLAPLVVDLDGTLTPSDTLVESTLQLVKGQPVLLLALPLWIARGRAALAPVVDASCSRPRRTATSPMPWPPASICSTPSWQHGTARI